MCDDLAKAQAMWKKVEEGPLAKAIEGLNREKNKLTATLNGNTVNIQILVKDNLGLPELPEELQSGLRDVDQSVRFHVALGLNGT